MLKNEKLTGTLTTPNIVEIKLNGEVVYKREIKEGILYDIYWNARRQPINLDKVNLVLKGNLHNLTPISKFETSKLL